MKSLYKLKSDKNSNVTSFIKEVRIERKKYE